MALPSAKTSSSTASNAAVNGQLPDAYLQLKDYYAYAKVLLGAKSLMIVDMMVSMPRGAFEQRMHDIDAITLKIHEYFSSKSIFDRLSICHEHMAAHPDQWHQWDLANIQEMERIYMSYSSLPSDVFSRLIWIQNAGHRIKTQAIKDNNLALAMDHMGHVVDIMRDVGHIKREKYKTDTVYDAILKGVMGDISDQEISMIRSDIRQFLKGFSRENNKLWGGDLGTNITAAPNHCMPHDIDPDGQTPPIISKRDIMWLGSLLLRQFGFDFHQGRLIISHSHPYCGGTNMDARILVRCEDPPNFFQTLSDILYQGGRGIYMQRIPENWADQPVGSLRGIPMVDAVSLLFEHFIGNMPAFFEYLSREIQTLPSCPQNDTYFNAANLRMQKHKFSARHSSDGSTRNLNDLHYNLLINDIERDLVNGDLLISELQDRWGQDLSDGFGFSPQAIENTTSNFHFMQISDWYTGNLGHCAVQNIAFISAAQIFENINNNIMDFDHLIAAGEFSTITDWLHQSLFTKAHSLPFQGLLYRAAGTKALNANVLDKVANHEIYA